MRHNLADPDDFTGHKDDEQCQILRCRASVILARSVSVAWSNRGLEIDDFRMTCNPSEIS